MDEESDVLEIKMILLGETAVGKTSIISRYVEDNFSDNVMSSTSMTYVQKKLVINKQKIQLNIWDTIGQEKFRSLSKLFFKDTKIVVLVYSITSLASFEGLDYWMNLYKETIGDEAILGVIGNKSDLFLEQEVDENKAIEFAEKNGGFFELISAKENKIGLDNYITKLVTEYLKKNPNFNKGKKKNIKLKHDDGEGTEELKAGCCAGEKNKRKIRKYGMIQKDENSIINAVFLGENSVGKTCIINRIKKKDFNPSETHTEQFSEFIYKYNKNKMKLDIKIHDIDNEKKKTKEFIDILKNSNIFFLVYDVKSKKSLDSIEYWIEVVTKLKDNINKDLFFILANKSDKSDGNENNEMISEGRNIATDNKFMFKSISAKDDEGISDLIDESVDNYLAIP